MTRSVTPASSALSPAAASPAANPARRRLFAAAAAGAAIGAVAAVPAAYAQAAWPTRPVTMLVPFPPGSSTDAIARALAPAVSAKLGQPVVVENRAGAAGTLATSVVAQSNNPDGYTVAIAPATIFKVPHLQKVPYDPMKDLTYILNFSGYSFALVVPAESPWKTYADFVAAAKAAPGKITVGASGSGSTGHAATVTLGKKAGAELTFVPFKGGAEVLQAFVGKHIDAVLDGGWPQAERQNGRVLAIFSEKRLERLPNVPTIRDLGIDMVSRSPIGLVGPKGMDPKIVKTLHDAFKDALQDPTYRRHLATFDLQDNYLSGADYVKLAQQMWVEERANLEALGMLKP